MLSTATANMSENFPCNVVSYNEIFIKTNEVQDEALL